MSDLEQQIRALRAASQSLAVARFLHDNPSARRRVNRAWLDGDVKRWRKRDGDEIAAEAAARLGELERWIEAAEREDPSLYEVRQIDAVHAQMNLESARSGSFATAAGPLADFLRQAGADPEVLHLG